MLGRTVAFQMDLSSRRPAVLLQTDAYRAWQTPSEILIAWCSKISVQFDF